MAVYTHPHPTELRKFLQEYTIGNLVSSNPIIDGIENSNFLIQTSTGTFVLTLYEERTDEHDLPFFIGLLNHAVLNKLSCPRPIPRNDGKPYGKLSGRPAHIFSYINGSSLNDVSDKHCAEVGYALALMHQKMKNFTSYRKNMLSLPYWKVLWKQCLLHDLDKDLKKEIVSELHFLEENWPKNLPTGIIHADLFPDNVLFHNDHIVGLIDFYFSCHDFLIYDFSICINAWCFDQNNTYNLSKGNSIFNGYNAIRTISENELQFLPILLRGASLRFFLTRLYDSYNIPLSPFAIKKDPMEYLYKLRFHKQISSISQYGFDDETSLRIC
ncbi:MAG: homoserine kinase [Candidatus Liberibacter ctenarytainae]|uniref:Homoserine kinase n=1 Tax=Candidatus Liberibacter ctenarytainae TaxID=2020335 RepID=A0A937AE91_9HYPH|nr:homoserine kinase [Candidatus Liberibacter ctenarytainae]